MARSHHANFLRANKTLGSFNAADRTIGLAANACYFAILNNINAAVRRRAGIAPCDCIVPRSAAAPLQCRADNGIARRCGDIEWRAKFLGLLRRQPFIINAIQPIGMNMAL